MATREGRDYEPVKLGFDLMKHLTTINAGSLLALVAFYEKITDKPVATVFVGIAIVGFLVSMAAGLFSMIVLLLVTPIIHGEMRRTADASGPVAMTIAIGALFVALFSLGAFALFNLKVT